MQRLPSLFPHGLTGIGLVLLRLAVGAGLGLLDPIVMLGTQADAAYFLGGVIALGLLAGLLTRWMALACCIAAIAMLHELEFATAVVPLLLWGLCAAASLLLGPGAYSLDALLFGRRVIKIPR